MLIIPAILVNNEKDFLNQTTAVENCTNLIQLDIGDGIFSKNKTWADPEFIKKQNLNLDLELHLMVEHPLKELKKWIDVEQVRRVLIPYECKDDLMSIIDFIDEQGWEKGIVLNPETSISVLNEYLDNFTHILFMSVTPGAQGQKFIPETLNKIIAFKQNNPEHFIEVDGGINEKTLPALVKTKVDALCIGSAIFSQEKSPAEQIHYFEQLINSLTE
ncbi:MAG TPA: hypothetical protein PK831_03585 [Candidatus Magasanikbacteria bacterium]|jgi:ribulose-phosphate 3-epimerase|nr:hypothetical protein [Candidatus Magasanikbacteria bacterium]